MVPSNELATALWLESDRLGFLLDTLDARKLQVQRDVVSNERRQSYENRPYGLTRLRTCDLLYPSPHPYYQCVIGSIPEIQAASVEDVKAFFREFYGPQNASLAIVGDFNPAQARALVEQYFGPIPAGPQVERPAVAQPMLESVVKETLEDPVAEVPRLDLIWNGTVVFAERRARPATCWPRFWPARGLAADPVDGPRQPRGRQRLRRGTRPPGWAAGSR